MSRCEVGHLTLPAHAHPLVKVLIAEMNRQRMSMHRLAEVSGVPRQTLYGWRRRSTPNVANLEAAFGVLGMTLVPVPIESVLSGQTGPRAEESKDDE